ncbi:2-dehydro-3-deoxygalactonokinase [Hoeflea sp. TYP-13]|uniref:2-dehydro-3-deoxygalactonokinase n=1 Tax=Hoeflea sp. TYP-13 TaxID=3230023 RepID=UPI0034C5CDFC
MFGLVLLFPPHRSAATDPELEPDLGMGRLQPDEFEGALVLLIEPWLTDGETIPVFACGMVGAFQTFFRLSCRANCFRFWLTIRYCGTVFPRRAKILRLS